MRHRKKTIKLGRTSAHRNELLANLVCALIDNKRIKTTLPKAKAARSLAEKMITLGKKGTLAARRQAISMLGNRDIKKALRILILKGSKPGSGSHGSRNSNNVFILFCQTAETVAHNFRPAFCT